MSIGVTTLFNTYAVLEIGLGLYINDNFAKLIADDMPNCNYYGVR